MLITDFMSKLHLELLKQEFHQYNVDEFNSIDLEAFGSSLLNYVNPKQQSRYEDRVQDIQLPSERISFQQFYGKSFLYLTN